MLIDGLYLVETKEKIDNRITAQIRIDAGHRVFEGHFPGQPVLPGVCMLQILKETAEDALGTTLVLTEGDNKFLTQLDPRVNPVATVELTVDHSEPDIFRVSGRLYFGEMTFLKFKGTFSSATDAYHTNS